MSILITIFYLIAAHFVVDFSLQNDTMAINKNRHANTELQNYVPWYYWMMSHAISHGAGVALITGSVGLGIAETICHFLIDYGKCDRWYSIHADQFLHIFCKFIWFFAWILPKFGI